MDTYEKSVKNYDMNIKMIKKMAHNQIVENHKKIKLQFLRVKEKHHLGELKGRMGRERKCREG
jgi:hypothetical protein